MSASAAKHFQTRDPRAAMNLGRSGIYTSFTRVSADSKDHAVAHLIDLSTSGALMISRLPVKAKIGDEIEIQFSLEENAQQIRGHARIVRQQNEFIFAIQFTKLSPRQKVLIQTAVAHSISVVKPSLIKTVFTESIRLVSTYRRGLFYAMAGLAMAGAVSFAIYLKSDEHQGKQLQSWGQDTPKEWYWDYVKKFNNAW